MARKIKGFTFMERHKNAWEERKALLHYKAIYGKDNMKVLFMQNQFGQPYTDIYLKEGAKYTKAGKEFIAMRKRQKKNLEKVM